MRYISNAECISIKHGLDALALTVFDAEHSEFEERWFTLGPVQRRQAIGGVAHVYDHGTASRSGAYHFGARSHPERTPAVRERTKVDQSLGEPHEQSDRTLR